MDDRELLMLAAKAAGMSKLTRWSNAIQDYDSVHCGEPALHEAGPGGECRSWNPLTDDGDALRLAMSLELGVVCKRQSDQYERNTSVVINPYCVGQLRITEPHKGNAESATRRAIVRAAAEIGRAM